MILADTSVWIDHFRRGNDTLVRALEADLVVCHPFIVGEIACGQLQRRGEILSLLDALPQVPSATDAEARMLLESRGLAGAGIGWVDVHLLASAAIAAVHLWTLDARLARVASAPP